MYLLAFIWEKFRAYIISVPGWTLPYLIPKLCVMYNVFSFLTIEGRCTESYMACGQDNIATALTLVVLVSTALSVFWTVGVCNWYSLAWRERRQQLKREYNERKKNKVLRSKPFVVGITEIPSRQEISSLGEGK